MARAMYLIALPVLNPRFQSSIAAPTTTRPLPRLAATRGAFLGLFFGSSSTRNYSESLDRETNVRGFENLTL